MTLIDKDAVIKALYGACESDTTMINRNLVVRNSNRRVRIGKAIAAINAMPETTDDALKEVERLTARLALAERVMRNLAKVLCSPRYDRGDGCGDEEKMLANYGWTKEDTE